MRQCKIRFVTLFPNCPNVGLVKDVGQIPYVLGQLENGIETKLVSSEINFEGENIDKVKGLVIEKFPYVLKSIELTGCLYLLKHAKEIDWLNIYQCGRKTYLWTKLYKLLNPNGKVYLKLDLDFVSCDIYEKNERERKLFSKVLGSMDLVSVESKAVLERIKKYADRDIKLISNGYCDADGFVDVTGEREDVFITVGRLGTEQKATEVLLEAFAKGAEQHNWNLILVGSIEQAFNSVIEKFFLEHPDLVHRVKFEGIINRRDELYHKYSKAKVFVLPSRWESFALVGPEALSCGCRIIISDQVPPMYEVTGEGKYGQIIPVDNVEDLATAMVEATKKTYTSQEAQEIANYAKEHFSWMKICEKLQQYIIE